MKQLLITGLSLAMAQLIGLADDGFTVLRHEHADLRVLYNPGLAPSLSILARDEDRGINYATNQVILVGKESSKLTLPSGTPFGNGGSPFWILPQSQNPKLLYLGVSAEGLSPADFEGVIKLRLRRLEGPGYMMVWQATGPGQFNIRINTRDGIDASDVFSTITGSHEHFNWGFSAPGLYRMTLQAEAPSKSPAAMLTSPESTFLFQILPLPPPVSFEEWQLAHWPPGFDAAVTGGEADADHDLFTNLQEYAFGFSPSNKDPGEPIPELEVDPAAEGHPVTLRYRRNVTARDLRYVLQASTSPTGPWTFLGGDESTEDVGLPGMEMVTLQDLDALGAQARFYRLEILPRP